MPGDGGQIDHRAVDDAAEARNEEKGTHRMAS